MLLKKKLSTVNLTEINIQLAIDNIIRKIDKNKIAIEIL